MSSMPAQKYLARWVALKESSSKSRRAVGFSMASNDFMRAPDDEVSMLYPNLSARWVNVD